MIAYEFDKIPNAALKKWLAFGYDIIHIIHGSHMHTQPSRKGFKACE